MRKSLAAAAQSLSVATLLCSAAAAGAKQFTVQTCTTEDRHAPLGPAIAAPNLPSGWEVGWSGAAWPATDRQMRRRRPLHLPDLSRKADGVGRQRLGQVDRGSRDAPRAPLGDLAGRIGPPPRPRAGNGAADGSDGSAGARLRRTRRSPSGSAFRTRPRSRLQSLPARWFELRFTCLDRCVTDAGRDVLRVRGLGSVRRRRLLAAGRRAHGRGHRRADVVSLHALRPQRRRRRRRPRPRGGRGRRRGCARRAAERSAGDVPRHRTGPGGPGVRRRPAVPAAHRQRLAGHRHDQAAAGPARRAGAARGCRGESDADLRAGHADDHLERGDRAGVGSGAARRGERRWGERPRAADGALGQAREPDAAGEPVRPRRMWSVGGCGRRTGRRSPTPRSTWSPRRRRSTRASWPSARGRGPAPTGDGASRCPRASPRAT